MVLLGVRETLVVARRDDALELEVVPEWRYVERWTSGGAFELELDYGKGLDQPLVVADRLNSHDPSVRDAQ